MGLSRPEMELKKNGMYSTKNKRKDTLKRLL
jgi:hypothetical protein